MVVIRLARGGAKKRPFFNIVATDSRNRRDGRFIERIGFYNPVAASSEEGLRIVQDRLAYWQGVGAQLSPTVARLVNQAGKKSSCLSLSSKMASGVLIPDDLVPVGYVSGAYGLNGWVRIKPYSTDADALLHAKTWWLDKPDFHDIEMRQAKNHSGDVVAQLMGIAGREAAEALKGAAVHISRKHFPALLDDEFYWVDLMGLAVENLQGESLGLVKDMMDNGAHPILRVAAPDVGDLEKAQQEILIPFVEQFVKTVDQKNKKITVDWGRDY